MIGAALPVAAAAERHMLAWDQSASLFLGSPVAAKVEKIAANWILEIFGLPRKTAFGFGTSATACTLACIAAARRSILNRHGWEVDEDGLTGAPEVLRILPIPFSAFETLQPERVLRPFPPQIPPLFHPYKSDS